jgi:hypothetical protein
LAGRVLHLISSLMWLPAMLLCAKGNGNPFSSFQKK